MKSAHLAVLYGIMFWANDGGKQWNQRKIPYVRYLCVALTVLWLAEALQIFSLTEASKELVFGAVMFGVPVVHGPVNVLMLFDIKN